MLELTGADPGESRARKHLRRRMRGVIHCDPKPARTKLREDETVQVPDFDLARVLRLIERGGVIRDCPERHAALLQREPEALGHGGRAVR